MVTMDGNGAIGKDCTTPGKGKLKANFDHFTATTGEKVVVVGRTTYDLTPKAVRQFWSEIVVLTRNTELIRGCVTLCHPEHVLRIYEDKEMWVIGGRQMFEIFLPYAKQLIVTNVETIMERADVFFPDVNWQEWESRELFHQEADKENLFSFSVVEYTRKNHS